MRRRASVVLAAASVLGALGGCASPGIVLPWSAPAPPAERTVIYFDHDAYKVEPSYRGLLEAHARRMRERPSLRLRIEASTDRQGAADYNRALALKRAQTVMKELVSRGVPAERIEIAGVGERPARRPGAPLTSPADRRVELVYRE